MLFNQLAAPLFALSCSAICLTLANDACPKLALYPFSSISKECYVNPDVLSKTTTIATNHGYQLETYKLTTSDGYILNVYKLTNNAQKPTKGPVFLMNGIVTGSATWVDIGNRSLAFVLVDDGFEVWLGNWRGTEGTEQHVSLNIHSPKYWEFNLDTLAKEDLRSQLKLVANKTETQQKIIYIGHSMGTTTSFMFASEFSDEAEELLQGLVALAPVAYLNGVLAIEAIKPFANVLIDVLNLIQVKGLFVEIEAVHNALNVLCKIAPHICKLILEIFFGPTTKFLADDLLVFYSYWPDRVSIFQLKQYLQITNAKTVQKFDFGTQKNKEIYGSETPPKYDLGKISKIPVRFFYGEADSLYRKENMDRLYNEVQSPNKRKYSAPTNGDGKYDHADFIYGKDLNENMYQVLLRALNTNFQES